MWDGPGEGLKRDQPARANGRVDKGAVRVVGGMGLDLD